MVYELGWLAQAGYKVMQRQSLACGPVYRNGGAAYGLLSNSPEFEPNPDYWTALLWTRVMGTRVLNVSVAFTQRGAAAAPPFPTPAGLDTTLRVFAHCARGAGAGAAAPHGAVAVAFANPQTYRVALRVGGVPAAPRDEYRLSPPAGDPAGLRSRRIALNGNVLSAQADGSVPALSPVEASAGDVALEPLTYGFLVFRNAAAPACM